MHPHPATNGDFGNRAHYVGEGRVSMFHVINCEGMVFTDDTVRSLLAVARQVAVGEVVVDHAQVAHDPDAFENRKREAGQPTYVVLIGR